MTPMNLGYQEELFPPPDDPLNDQSNADQTVEFSELIAQSAFIGEIVIDFTLDSMIDIFCDNDLEILLSI